MLLPLRRNHAGRQRSLTARPRTHALPHLTLTGELLRDAQRSLARVARECREGKNARPVYRSPGTRRPERSHHPAFRALVWSGSVEFFPGRRPPVVSAAAAENLAGFDSIRTNHTVFSARKV